MEPSSRQPKAKKRKRVFFRFSHYVLAVQPPLVKKPKSTPLATLAHRQQQQEEKEQDQYSQEEEMQQHSPTKEHQKHARAVTTTFQRNSKGKSKSFLEKLQMRLSGGQFRMLNETLYTSSGEEAFKIFKDDPASFKCYHAGYQDQMSQWPSHPLDVIVQWLKKRSPSLVVADFGCGDGRLAKSVKNKVFSLDLVATDPSIIACNMAHTPLKTQSVDVAVFCLSLMGTDYGNFLVESHRVLKQRGSLLIAEVRSRFDPENGGADPNHFADALKSLGFLLVSKDLSNKFFIIFEFKKADKKGISQLKWPALKPCLYKRR